MKQFTLLTSLLLLQLPSAHAHWYAGANLGINSVTVKKTLSYPITPLPSTTARYQSAYNNIHGQLFWGKVIYSPNKIGIALEAAADWFNDSSNYTIDNFFLTTPARAKEQLKYGFGLYLLPEYHYNNSSRFFVGPGINTSQFSIRSGYTGGNVGTTGSYTQWLNAWGIKLGIASTLTQNSELMISYQFNQYNSMTKSNIEPLSADILSGRYKPYTNIVMLGLRLIK